MKQTGIKPDLLTYGCMIKACNICGDSIWAKEVLKEMKTSGIKPDVLIFGAMIHLTGQQSLDEAFYYFNLMKEFNLPPNERICSTLIRLCHSNPKRGIALLQEIPFEPTREIYESLIHALTLSPEPFLVVEWIATMKEKGLKPSLLTCRALVKIFKKIKDGKQALKLLQDFEKHEVAIIEMYNRVIYIYAKNQDLVGAEETFQQLLKTDLRPTLYTCNALLLAYAEVNEIDKGILFMNQEFNKWNLTPDTVSFNTLRIGYIRAVL